MMEQINKLLDELFDGYKSGKRGFGITRNSMTDSEWIEVTDALRYIEDKGIIKTAKAAGFWDISFTSFGIDAMERRKEDMREPSLYDFADSMQTVNLKRNSEIYEGLKVVFQKNEERFDFPPDSPIIPQVGDVVVVRNREYCVTDVSETCLQGDNLYAYEASIKQSQVPTASPVFNIQNASNSIIGTQQNANMQNISSLADLRDKAKEITNEQDAEQLNKLISLLEVSIENNTPVSKGFLAKFSDVLKKHSDFATAIGVQVIKWLSGAQ